MAPGGAPAYTEAQMSIKLVMPSLGESVIEGTVTKWLVREGDVVAREQAVVAVATDKADTEVPATSAGRIIKILVAEGATVKAGDPLCELDTDAAGATASPGSSAGATVPAPPPEGMIAAEAPPPSSVSKRRSSPAPAQEKGD